MPKRATLRTISPTVRRQLHARLISTDFGDLVRLSEWLASRGYQVSKSTLGAYAKRHRAEIETAHAARRACPALAPGDELHARLLCLDIAARTGPEASALKRAERYLRWAMPLGSESGKPR